MKRSTAGSLKEQHHPLAGVQAPKVLYEKWAALWARGDLARIWEVTTAGMRISDPERALEQIPDMVARCAAHPDLDLGSMLWGLYADEPTKGALWEAALAALPEAERARCAAAVARMDSDEELEPS